LTANVRLTSGRPASGDPRSVGESDVEICRICSLMAIAWSSSNVNGAERIFR
jgi:hypothetical protein